MQASQASRDEEALARLVLAGSSPQQARRKKDPADTGVAESTELGANDCQCGVPEGTAKATVKSATCEIPRAAEQNGRPHRPCPESLACASE